MPRLLTAVCGLLVAAVTSAAGEKVLAEKPVPIVTTSDLEMFPESWRKAPITATGEAVAKGHEKRAVAVIEKALKKYPPAVLKKYVRKVYVLSELKFRGVTAGGTNSQEDVYVKVRDEVEGFTDEWVEQVFHAELSSILLRENEKRFDTPAWVKFNPKGFKYLGDGVDAIKQNKADLKEQDVLMADGFLREYSKASVEEDFNGFAALLLTGRKELWEAADRHPKVAGKLKLTIEFYQSIDKEFSEKALRALAPK